MIDRDDTFDPEIAQRFEMLEQVPVPEVTGRPLASVSALDPAPSSPRSGFLVAVAAAALLGVITLGAVVVVGGGSDSSDDPVAAADSSTADPAGSPADDIDTPVTTSPVESTANTMDPRGDELLVVEGDDDESVSATEGSQAADDGAGYTSATATGKQGTNTRQQVDRSTTSPPTTMADPASTTTGPATSSSTSQQPQTGSTPSDPAGETVTVSGLVTEVFTDCRSHLLLNDSGQVVEGDLISCDGGSYLVIGGRRVYTSSGFTLADKSYNKHPDGLRPGGQATAVAAPVNGSDGPLGLGCDTCRLTLG